MNESIHGFSRYLWRHHRGQTLGIAAVLWLSALLDGLGFGLVLPLLVSLTESGRAIAPWAALIVAAFLAKAVIRWIALRQVAGAVTRVAQRLRADLFDALLTVDWRFFVHTPAGHLSAAAGMEAYGAAYGFRRVCGALAAALQLIVYVVLIALVSVPLALAGAGFALLSALALRTLVRAGREGSVEQSAGTRAVVSSVTQLAHTLKPARAMARESMLRSWLNDANEKLSRAERRQLITFESIHVAQEPLAVVTVLVTLYLASTSLGASTPQLLLLGVLLYRMLTQAKLVQTEYQGLVWAAGTFAAIRRQVEAARAMPERRSFSSEELPRFRLLQLRDVGFRYDGRPIFERLNIDIAAGALVVVRGSTGRGKTTLLDLLAGLYTPTSGTIAVDGVPLSSLSLPGWRRGLGYLTQEPALLHDTVRQNVTLGMPVTSAELERALELAGAREFVRDLPQQLDTVVGEQGFRLSGGQRQRLALARALLNRPQLLLLDEPTASVDPATERLISEALLRLKGETTIVVASHRAVFDQGADATVML